MSKSSKLAMKCSIILDNSKVSNALNNFVSKSIEMSDISRQPRNLR